ncbi:MAG TPA: hypothetical protein VF394_02930 [Candidatus Acidoferrum sp.]
MSKQSVRNRDVLGSCCGAGNFRGLALLGAFCGVIGVMALMPGVSAGAGIVEEQQDQSGAGVMVSKQATTKEVGLPVYPGAKPHKDEKDDSGAVQMGIWGSSFGFKLAVMKMESNEAPEKIAEFYKKALAKYGTVLNCSDAAQNANAKDKTGSSKRLECGDDKPEKGGLLFKAGTKERQHIVGIQPNGQGTIFQLVYVEARGDDKEKKAD